MNISVKADIKEVTRYLNKAQKQYIPKATVKALNRTADSVITAWARETRKEWNIKVGAFKKKIKKIGARVKNLVAILTTKPIKEQDDKGFEWAAFSIGQTKKKGVWAKLKTNKPKKFMGTNTFITPKDSWVKRHAWRRHGEKRLMTKGTYKDKLRQPIDIPRTIKIDSMLAQTLGDRRFEILKKVKNERFRKEFNSAIAFFTDRGR